MLSPALSPDDTVTMTIHKPEFGQGTVTSLSMLLAEELECDWKKVKTQFADTIDPMYMMGAPIQGVYGSTAIRTSWEPLKAGATACQMLLEAAAAQHWNVNRDTATREWNGVSYMAPKHVYLWRARTCGVKASPP